MGPPVGYIDTLDQDMGYDSDQKRIRDLLKNEPEDSDVVRIRNQLRAIGVWNLPPDQVLKDFARLPRRQRRAQLAAVKRRQRKGPKP